MPFTNINNKRIGGATTMKRGVSPLIATVMIVGFTIAIAALFWLWGSGTIDDSEKALYIEAGKQICATQVDFKVTDCDAATFAATITNEGSVPITFFKFRDDTGESVTHQEEITEGETKTVINNMITEDTEIFAGILTEEGFPVVCADEVRSC